MYSAGISSSEAAKLYRFGEFELRPDQGELLRSGRPVPIQPQPLRVLTLLVEHAGTLLRREELFAQLWGKDTHVDFDRGLNYCIRRIRTALGDSATRPRFIQTVPRFGYRFVAPVTVEQPGVSTGRRRRRAPELYRWAATGALLLLVLSGAGVAWRLGSSPPEAIRADPRATEELLRGRHLIEAGSPEDTIEGLRHLEAAVALDPDFARAHLALARALSGIPDASGRNLARARSALVRSIELDDGLAEAHALMGTLRLYVDWDFAGAEAAYRHAIDLQPADAERRHELANLLALAGRHQGALEQIELAMELDPVSTSIKADAGWFYYQARRFDEAQRLCELTFEIDRGNENALWCLLQVHRLGGRQSRALQTARRLADLLDPNSASTIADLESFWRWHLDWLQRNPGAASPSARGLDHLALGETEQALEIFEQAYARRSSCVLSLASDPQLDPLRGNPRFRDLLGELLESLGIGFTLAFPPSSSPILQ